MTASPNRQPEGIPAGGQFAPGTHAEPGVMLASQVAQPKIMASVTLQQWHNEYAIDIETVEFDAGRVLAEMSPEKRSGLEDCSEDADQLYDTAVRRGLVQDHDGPFSVYFRQSMEDAEETDPDVYTRILAAPVNRPTEAVLDTPLSAYEIGTRVDEHGWVSGLATMDMSDLIANDIEGINDKIGNGLVGSELLMEPNATPVDVLDGGTILMRYEGNASAVIEGFDEEELADYESGRAASTNNR
jgi:hypothetical protein